MEKNQEKPIWEDIRPYLDEEMQGVAQEMSQDEEFVGILKQIMPDKAELLIGAMLQSNSVHAFKENVSYHLVREILKRSSFSCDISGRSNIEKNAAYTFISNHRDIVLDSAFLNILLFESGFTMPRIAIGDNLFARPWVKKLVRMNDSFIVQRALAPREFLLAAKALSSYIHHSIQEDNSSVWIAQREGRAKDSDDRTQAALLKMVGLSGEGNALERLISANIVPVSISYEYDPCDYLKARELYYKKLNGTYPKTKEEDFLNMKEGIVGYKGRIHFSLGKPLVELIKNEEIPTASNAMLQKVAELLDQEIHQEYRLYPGNFIAEDMLKGNNYYFEQGNYSSLEKDKFLEYINGQIKKTGLGDEATEELRELLFLMYANPLRNYYTAQANRA